MLCGVSTTLISGEMAKVEWAILDTSVVRGIIESESGAMDPESLAVIKGSLRISIADGAVAEILYWLARAPVEVLDAVQPALLRLDRCLDQEFPLAPSARGAASLAGIVPWKRGDLREEQASHSRASWKHLCGIRSREDLTRPLQYFDSAGRLASLVPNLTAPSSLLRGMQQSWLPGLVAENFLEQGIERMTDAHERELIAHWREKLCFALGINLSDSRSRRLDLYLQSLARRVRIHRPLKRPTSNAAMDQVLLLYLLLPALICTTDAKFVNFIQALDSSDCSLVMTPDDLMRRLKAVKQ